MNVDCYYIAFLLNPHHIFSSIWTFFAHSVLSQDPFLFQHKNNIACIITSLHYRGPFYRGWLLVSLLTENYMFQDRGGAFTTSLGTANIRRFWLCLFLTLTWYLIAECIIYMNIPHSNVYLSPMICFTCQDNIYIPCILTAKFPPISLSLSRFRLCGP